jgi:hypothetical protein
VGGDGAYMGEIRDAYEILVRKLERKRLLGTCKFRLEDSIKLYFYRNRI